MIRVLSCDVLTDETPLAKEKSQHIVLPPPQDSYNSHFALFEQSASHVAWFATKLEPPNGEKYVP